MAQESGILAVEPSVAVWQWRARSTLVTSRRIAGSLGFVELGRQATYRLPGQGEASSSTGDRFS